MESAKSSKFDYLPQSKEEADQAEKALTRELEKLSVREREQILFDIHGVAEQNGISDDEAIAAKLEELQVELSLLTENEKAAAYVRASSLDLFYVEDEVFRLQFLRMEQFDAKKAAEKFVLHFQVKWELFVHQSSSHSNDEILVRDVTWEDLTEESRSVVSSGYFQVGSQRDVAGRVMFLVLPRLMDLNWMAESIGQAMWYILMSTLRTDIDINTRGAVLIVLQSSLPPLNTIRVVNRVRSTIPFVTTAVHQCCEDYVMHLAAVGFKFLLYAVSAEESLRTRSHYGTMEQITFELQTFGIPVESYPFSHIFQKQHNNKNHKGLSVEENMKFEWHQMWLRKIQESELKQNTIQDSEDSEDHPEQNATCIIPRRFDVLFGRHKQAWEHPGTFRCRHIVQQHYDEYENASRRDKTKVAKMVIEQVHSVGGRFLRCADQDELSAPLSLAVSWVVVDDKEARNKVSHMFRNMRAFRQQTQVIDSKDAETRIVPSPKSSEKPFTEELTSKQNWKQRKTTK